MSGHTVDSVVDQKSGVDGEGPLIVFVSGLYPPDGSDSVSIQTRDYIIGLMDKGEPVGTLDMLEQGGRSTVMKVARSCVLHAHARGYETVGLAAARLLLTCVGPLAWLVELLRRARGMGVKATRPHAAREAPADPPPDPESVRVRSVRMKRGAASAPWASAREVACVVNGYDLLFSPRWGGIWRGMVESVIRQLCPDVVRLQFFVHVINETTRVAPALAQGLLAFDEVWPAAEFQVDALRRSGLVHGRVHTVGGAVDTSIFHPGVPARDIPGRRGCCFLTLSQYGLGRVDLSDSLQSTHRLALAWNHARKATDLLLRAFVEEFRPDEDVCLVLKSTRPDAEIQDELARALAAMGCADRVGQIIAIGGWTDRRDLPRLYAACDALVLVSRGEGWGRPLAEAMAMGIPAVATRFGGNLEFMDDENSYLVDARLVPVTDTLGPRFAALGAWAEPSVASLRATLRQILNNPADACRRGTRAAADIQRRFSRAALADALAQRVRTSFHNGSARLSSKTQHVGTRL